MHADYQRFVTNLCLRYDVPREQVEQRVRNRRMKSHGLLSPLLAARTLSASLALGEMEARFGRHLAAGARHVSGLQEADAIHYGRVEAAAGRLSTLGYWAPPGEQPAAIAAHYVRAIEAVAAAGIPASVSIKADQLAFNPALLSNVFNAARACEVRVHFDAQGHDTISRTHDVVEDALLRGTDVSATLAARFQRSIADAERFIRLGIPVRVVKGQGGDPQHPRMDPRRSMLELLDCLAGRAALVGVATHDRRVAEPGLDRLVAAGTPCDLEQMRSLPRLDFLATQRHLPLRIYIAYGHAGLPYAIGELRRRPAIAAWILRDLLLRRLSPKARQPSSKP